MIVDAFYAAPALLIFALAVYTTVVRDTFSAAVGFLAYGLLLTIFVPLVRDRSNKNSEARSMIVGRIVDSYTNILTLKLFARL